MVAAKRGSLGYGGSPFTRMSFTRLLQRLRCDASRRGIGALGLHVIQ